jgi:ATP-dependent helicase HrpB
MHPPTDVLPIEPVLPELRQALATAPGAVLQAPPGAGKTTRVPLALMDEPWVAGRRIIMLEPRRLAARAAARRMAEVLGEEPGGTVGYRIRQETRVSAATRIEVVTEGVLTRMLLSDPALEGYGLVIFDEFHERSIHADLGLALTLQARAILRPELRVLVMSATLDGGPVAALLGHAPIVTSEGRSFPVETHHLTVREGIRLEAAVAGAVRDAIAEDRGDVLAFLPGAAEIRRTEALLPGLAAEVIPLHGMLPQALQDRALRPHPAGRRRVVLSTSIAETSLTIDGVRVVVDSGLARVPRYSPRTGMTRLATVRVSRASADQRRGRAGRQGPGVCYRLWGAHEDHALLAHGTPEILEADLAPLALELAAAGVAAPAELAWLDPPRPAALAEARALLTQLGALDDEGRITPHGHGIRELSLHPRLAHMVVAGRSLGAGGLACELAALLSERDVVRHQVGAPDADLDLRLDVLRGAVERADVDRDALRRVRAEARLCGQPGTDVPVSTGVLLALAYPDRIAQRRPGAAGRFRLRNGLGAFLDPQALAKADHLVAAELDGRPRQSRIFLAARITRDEIEAHFANQIAIEDVLEWDAAARAVVAVRRRRLGALVLQEAALHDPDPEAVTSTFLEGVRRQGVAGLPWNGPAKLLRARLAFLRRLDGRWPDVSDAALDAGLERWLRPWVEGLRQLADLGRIDLEQALRQMVPWERRNDLERLAPSHVQVPSGSRIQVDYTDPAAPVLAVRLQELFGAAETPAVGAGGVPLTLHLLSPAGRPVQVTRDLAGFWRTTYFDVRRDLKARYPRHPWPDDPRSAEPTRHAKRRRTRGT